MMPTFNEETLQERHSREWQDQLSAYGRMTPEQIFAIDIARHNVEAHLDSMKCKLVQIHDALSSIGDTDPMIDDDMTDDEIREYEPVFWSAKEIAALIGDAPWDKYTAALRGKEGVE